MASNAGSVFPGEGAKRRPGSRVGRMKNLTLPEAKYDVQIGTVQAVRQPPPKSGPTSKVEPILRQKQLIQEEEQAKHSPSVTPQLTSRTQINNRFSEFTVEYAPSAFALLASIRIFMHNILVILWQDG